MKELNMYINTSVGKFSLHLILVSIETKIETVLNENRDQIETKKVKIDYHTRMLHTLSHDKR